MHSTLSTLLVKVMENWKKAILMTVMLLGFTRHGQGLCFVTSSIALEKVGWKWLLNVIHWFNMDLLYGKKIQSETWHRDNN